jgi:EmrB/QacA subfamily drug resistance transporter
VAAKKIVLVCIALQIAILMSALDQTVLNIVIPKIAGSLKAADRAAWIITSYLLFSTIATPIAGKLADIYGAKKVLISAVLLFAIASALCGAAGLVPVVAGADAIDQLILARGLQGLAGGGMLGLCFVSIGEVFPAGERGKYQGFLAAAFIVAALAGPTMGGAIADKSTWRWVFFLNLPLSAIAAALLAVSFPVNDRAKAKPIIDYLGIALFIGFIVPTILGAACTDTFRLVGYFALAALCLAGFIRREQKAPEPLIPPRIFGDRLVAISLATVFVTGIGLFGSMLLLATVLQQLLGLSATKTGLTLTPLMIVVASASIASGWILSKSGKYKGLILSGLAIFAGGTAALASLMAAGPFDASRLNLFLSAAACGGVGLGVLLPIHTIIIQKAVSAEIMGVATSMTQFFRSLGGTVGTGLMTAIMLYLLKTNSMQSATAQVSFIYAGLIVATLVLNLFMPEVLLAGKGTQKESVKPEEAINTNGQVT